MWSCLIGIVRKMYEAGSLGQKAFIDKRKLFWNSLNLDFSKRMIKCFTWSVALYVAETWTLTKADTKQLVTFKVWIWRRMLKISWKDSVTNVSVRAKVDKERRMLNTVWE